MTPLIDDDELNNEDEDDDFEYNDDNDDDGVDDLSDDCDYTLRVLIGVPENRGTGKSRRE